jgi:hypothetical protein
MLSGSEMEAPSATSPFILSQMAGVTINIGEIGKWRQLNEMEQNGAVQDLSFYEMR